jgi:hypothetical protein
MYHDKLEVRPFCEEYDVQNILSFTVKKVYKRLAARYPLNTVVTFQFMHSCNFVRLGVLKAVWAVPYETPACWYNFLMDFFRLCIMRSEISNNFFVSCGLRYPRVSLYHAV